MPRAELDRILHFLVSGARSADSLVDGLLNCALALEAEIRGSGAQISYGELPRVPGDPDRLMQLFENLLRNAIEHRGDAPPCIQVSAQLQNAEWLFAVRDNGPGIEAEDLERIFRLFERLRRDHRGAGLGLAICREIVTAHRGRIWAESVMESGTTVFPRYRRRLREFGSDARQEPRTQITQKGSRGRHTVVRHENGDSLTKGRLLRTRENNKIELAPWSTACQQE